MNKKKILYSISVIVFIVLEIFLKILYDDYTRETKIIKLITSNGEIIKKYCRFNNIQKRLYVSVIYGELNSNLNFFDEFDDIRAEYGYDPSVGFGQIRVSTFMWLEENYSDGKYIIKSKTEDELIKKILDIDINIKYTTFYIKLIREKLSELLELEPSVISIASQYSLGIDHGKRKINPNFVSPVGQSAKDFYYSDKLLGLFPK